jgi:hypothetical protein
MQIKVFRYVLKLKLVTGNGIDVSVEPTASVFRNWNLVWTYKTWRKRNYISPKLLYKFTTLYDAIKQTTWIVITTAVRNSNFAVTIAFTSPPPPPPLPSTFPLVESVPVATCILSFRSRTINSTPSHYWNGTNPFSRLSWLPKNSQRFVMHQTKQTKAIVSDRHLYSRIAAI